MALTFTSDNVSQINKFKGLGCMIFAKNKVVVAFLAYMFAMASISAQKNNNPDIQSFVSDTEMANASISVSVTDTRTGKMLASYESNKSLIPASSIKVITTATALAILGKDYRFKTELSYDGIITKDGVLKGNIYIKGYGDPTLGAMDKPIGNASWESLMKEWVDKIKSKGIKKIEGKIIGDATVFESAVLSPSWQWNDIGNYYGAGAFGLNINANTYELEFKKNPTQGGKPTVLRTIPYIQNLLFINELESGAWNSGDNCYIYGGPYEYTRFLRGAIPSGDGKFVVKGSIPEPVFTCAALLLQELESQSIPTSKLATTIMESKRDGTFSNARRTLLHTHESLPLIDIINITNEESINLYCEAMLKTIAKKQKGIGSLEKGVEAIMEYWENKGFESKGFFMEDGSGLSPRNAISSKHFAEILRLISNDPILKEDFKKSLPVGGKTGTLENMFRNSPARGKIFAKTGSMSRIRSYTGYVEANSGKELSFSIIINNYTCSSSIARQKLEKLMESFIKL